MLSFVQMPVLYTFDVHVAKLIMVVLFACIALV